MLFKCKPVDLHFFKTAPYFYEYKVKINAPSQEVFKVLNDWNSWPKWYPTIKKIKQTGTKPNGLGATRITTMKNLIAANETFFIWEANKRIAFYTTETNLPSARSLAEMYELSEIDPSSCLFTYTVGMDPILPLGLTGNFGRNYVEKIFLGAAKSLAAYIEENKHVT